MSELLKSFGLVPSDLGSHSIRKGAGTLLCSSTSPPSYASICIRMSWTLGNIQERYLHYNIGADAYCGRILAGLNQSSVRFALLPPHFSTSICSTVTDTIFPAFSKLISLQQVKLFCLGSLLFHHPFLCEHLPTNHTFHYSPFTRCRDKMTELGIISGVTSGFLRGTGIPPHVQTWLQGLETQSLLVGLPEKILGGIGDVLKENSVAAGNVTKEMLEDIMRKMLELDRENRDPQCVLTQEKTSNDWPVYLWKDGVFRRLPEDFTFPHLTILQCWALWWHGNQAKKTPPLRLLNTSDVPKEERKRWSDIRCLMSEVLSVLLKTKNLTKEDLSNKPPQELSGLCLEATGVLFVQIQKKNHVRKAEWMVTTAIREIRTARTKENPSLKRKQKTPVPKGTRQPKRNRDK